MPASGPSKALITGPIAWVDMSSSSVTRRLSLPDLEQLCTDAVLAAGGSPHTAAALADATVAAERRGKSAVGAAHLADYLDGLRTGRINGDAQVRIEAPRVAVITADADRGTAQLAFDRAASRLAGAARACGIAALSVFDTFSAGELGHYAHRLAGQGLIALACSNSPALMSVHGARAAITGTNPLAFALPHPNGPRVFDQAASATAWVRVRDAAARGEAIPPGWALGPDGEPTTNAASALAGALLPFGGAKGANIALMIEMLAAMSGGSFSRDAAPFDSGAESPRLGLFVAAIDPSAFAPDYPERAEQHLQRLVTEHGVDFGRRREPVTHVDLPEALVTTLREGTLPR